MAARRDLKATPKAYLIDETAWPEGPLTEPKPEVEFLMEIARRLKAQIDATSNRAVARAAGIDPQTVINIIKGDTWCEVPTIFHLEKGLQISLWPKTHITTSRPRRQRRPSLG